MDEDDDLEDETEEERGGGLLSDSAVCEVLCGVIIKQGCLLIIYSVLILCRGDDPSVMLLGFCPSSCWNCFSCCHE